MELLALVLSIVACSGLAFAALLWRSFMPAYLSEKAKNLASKEDLAHLTGLVEAVKALHTAEIERLKASLAIEAKTTERRRLAHEEICGALRVFIDGHGSSEAEKGAFHAAYAAAWLWASDEAVGELNRFIALQRQHSEDPSSVPQQQMKSAYAATVLALRRDAGYSGTAVQAASYQFVRF